jgi:hypothetical protein
MKQIRIIVAGSRDFNDLPLLTDTLSSFISELALSGGDVELEIVSGGARGADRLGERFAYAYHIPISLFEADWEKHGKSAGYRRNEEMAKYATHLIAFWDGESKGTKHMIDLAAKHNLIVKVIRYDK